MAITFRDTRLGALAVVLALVTAFAACGSDDGDDSGAATAKTKAQPAVAPGTDTPEGRRVEAVYEQMVDAILKKRGAEACGLLTARARKQFARKSGRTCIERMSTVGESTVDGRPRIYSVRVQGNRALAEAGLPSTKKYPIPFTKQHGEWKIAGGF